MENGKYSPELNPIIITCKAADYLPIDSVLKFQGDLKKLSRQNKYKLVNSICEEGFMAPIFVWDASGENRILDGHQRITALIWMRQKGWEIPLLPVVYIEASDEKEARRKLLKITSQYGEFDMDELNKWAKEAGEKIMESIRIVDQELEITFQKEEVPETDGDDDVPEDVVQVTSFGDMWDLGNHRLLCGDSTKKEDVERLMGGVYPDIVQTDPPYGMNAVSKSGVLKDKYKTDIIGDDSPDVAKLSFSLIHGMFSESNHVWWGANYYCSVLPDSECWIVWDKNNGDSDQTDCELGWANFRSVVRQFTMASEKKNRVHPTQKPVALVEWIFRRFKLSAETIADFFGGSGVTVIAAEKNGKTSFVMEYDPHFCDVIVHRYKAWCELNHRECIIKLNGKVWNG